MENSHSRGSAESPGDLRQTLPDYTEGYVWVYVNQDNNLPILWRFSACPTPSFLRPQGRYIRQTFHYDKITEKG